MKAELIPGPNPFGLAVEQQAILHAREEHPRESVGYVSTDFRYIKLQNISDSPEDSFVVDGYVEDMLALIHSHPSGLGAPSAADMQQQAQFDIPWGIVTMSPYASHKVEWFGDTLEPPPYLQRDFLSGVRDCWCLIRDWYRKEHGIVLHNLPRDDNWFRAGQDLLNETTIKNAGFYLLEDHHQLRVGDVVLGKIGSRVVNHCGMYLDRGRIMHHVSTRRSCIEPLYPWLKYCRWFVRHQKSDEFIDAAKAWLAGGLGE